MLVVLFYYPELIISSAGTTGNTQVREYIKATLSALNWDIEEDRITLETPIGSKEFVNIIATKDPEAARKVSLAAHFDSKYFPPGSAYEGVRVISSVKLRVTYVVNSVPRSNGFCSTVCDTTGSCRDIRSSSR